VPEVAYTVVATLPDEPTLREYVAWLLGGHIQAIVRGGATSADVIGPLPGVASGPGLIFRVESRYIFPTPEAFATYEAVHAPALRADGVTRFGNREGISFARSVGLVVGRELSTKDRRA
jgi:hypothetical protein